jgi:acyl carrier protein
VVEIAEKVRQIIGGHLGIDSGGVFPDASLVDDLGADSLDTVELVIAFEAAFEIEVPQDDVERIRTVQDAIDYVTARKSG